MAPAVAFANRHTLSRKESPFSNLSGIGLLRPNVKPRMVRPPCVRPTMQIILFMPTSFDQEEELYEELDRCGRSINAQQYSV